MAEPWRGPGATKTPSETAPHRPAWPRHHKAEQAGKEEHVKRKQETGYGARPAQKEEESERRRVLQFHGKTQQGDTAMFRQSSRKNKEVFQEEQH